MSPVPQYSTSSADRDRLVLFPMIHLLEYDSGDLQIPAADIENLRVRITMRADVLVLEVTTERPGSGPMCLLRMPLAIPARYLEEASRD